MCLSFNHHLTLLDFRLGSSSFEAKVTVELDGRFEDASDGVRGMAAAGGGVILNGKEDVRGVNDQAIYRRRSSMATLLAMVVVVVMVVAVEGE